MLVDTHADALSVWASLMTIFVFAAFIVKGFQPHTPCYHAAFIDIVIAPIVHNASPRYSS